MIESAARLSLEYVREDVDPDLAGYLVRLRATILDAYVVIVHGVHQS
jgi:hypothetical protein